MNRERITTTSIGLKPAITQVSDTFNIINRIRGLLRFLGPAFVVSVAYIDPGNFAAMATTMAEFLGGVLGFYLLFAIPLSYSVILTATVTFIIISLQKYGQRIVEIVITILVDVICASYTIEIFLAKPDWPQVALFLIVLFP